MTLADSPVVNLPGSTVQKPLHRKMMKGYSFDGSRPVNFIWLGGLRVFPHSHSAGRDSMADRAPKEPVGKMAN